MLIDLIDSRGKKEKNSDIFYDSLTIMNVGGDDDSGESDSELLGNVDYRPLQASELDISHVLLDDLHSTFIIFLMQVKNVYEYDISIYRKFVFVIYK